jgi:pyruvate dehydrogenase E1 component alpha subunit
MEKEIRKQVDDAIAKAKVPLHLDMLLSFFCFKLVMLTTAYTPVDLQESSMPDTSELFTNVYKKGFGVEVSCQKKSYLHAFTTSVFVPNKLSRL